MSPPEAVPQDAAGQQPVASPVLFDSLPTETLIEILSYTDFETFDNIRATSQRLRSITDLHWYRILPVIIERDFHPVKEFFATLFDADVPDGMTCSRLLMVSDTLDGLHPLLDLCRVIKRWEAEYPRLRFANVPMFSRSLRPHELCRLRQALYLWWKFARIFHGHATCPVDNSVDARRAFMRQFSSARLHEAYDMWETVRRAVGGRVCPSVTAIMGLEDKFLPKEAGARIGWGDYPVNSDIVNTMMKLLPDDILHLLVYRHRYATKSSVIDFVRFRHPRIEENVATFGEATVNVFRERDLSFLGPFSQAGFPEPYGGILDHEHLRVEARRTVHDGDAGVGDANYPGLSSITRRGRLEPNL
ncbi:hypothetical protein B0I37DRAFT_126388 [Chaetomium sp. MPI-CAGE-AT-0009]|nr:hypothetical protein B0I37DRAFT_126388 [Chaetomium sp. MPI-CAGE-AT-0009]